MSLERERLDILKNITPESNCNFTNLALKRTNISSLLTINQLYFPFELTKFDLTNILFLVPNVRLIAVRLFNEVTIFEGKKT